MPMKEAIIPCDFAAARRYMVEGQLRPCGISDSRLLAAMNAVPREIFVPFTHVGVAYIDDDIRLISNRYLMRPLTLARLLQAAQIGPTDRVLELAPATGYSTLVLTKLAASVLAVEPDSLLHSEAEKNVAALAPGKAIVLAGAPIEGCAAQGPFDVIFINGIVESVPTYLYDHLDEGGRLVAIVGPENAKVGEARLCTKNADTVSCVPLFETAAFPAPGFFTPKGFEF